MYEQVLTSLADQVPPKCLSMVWRRHRSLCLAVGVVVDALEKFEANTPIFAVTLAMKFLQTELEKSLDCTGAPVPDFAPPTDADVERLGEMINKWSYDNNGAGVMDLLSPPAESMREACLLSRKILEHLPEFVK